MIRFNFGKRKLHRFRLGVRINGGIVDAGRYLTRAGAIESIRQWRIGDTVTGRRMEKYDFEIHELIEGEWVHVYTGVPTVVLPHWPSSDAKQQSKTEQ